MIFIQSIGLGVVLIMHWKDPTGRKWAEGKG